MALVAIQQISKVLALPRQACTRGERSMLLVLANFADPDGGNIYPKIGTLADRGHVSVRWARLMLARLCEKGFLAVVVKGDGPGKRTTYRLALDQPRQAQAVLPFDARPRRRRAAAEKISDLLCRQARPRTAPPPQSYVSDQGADPSVRTPVPFKEALEVTPAIEARRDEDVCTPERTTGASAIDDATNGTTSLCAGIPDQEIHPSPPSQLNPPDARAETMRVPSVVRDRARSPRAPADTAHRLGRVEGIDQRPRDRLGIPPSNDGRRVESDGRGRARAPAPAHDDLIPVRRRRGPSRSLGEFIARLQAAQTPDAMGAELLAIANARPRR